MFLVLAFAATGCFPLRSDSAAFRFFPSELNSEQTKKIEILWRYVEDLKPRGLKTGSSFYERNSKFERYFGFSFSGPALRDWLRVRISGFKSDVSQDYAAHYHRGIVYLNREFFRFSLWEQTLVLVHEARHSDGTDFQHVVCPSGFPYLSLRKPETKLEGMAACDDREDGAYGFGAAFLFEMYCYGLYPENHGTELLGMYNSELGRIVAKR
ncbi:hypothetical protein [Leptospira ellisii]|uniref:Uncharacterized protein n=1 Tax=Leptospira ellisii TaxID=2023197 RepID=A0A2N0BLG3_9LEPT|nr:hypothetical protein CH379_02080 [Leptospira ellisii]PKA04708.1 hypothetical protein CH375_09395 [Leptospira ellisii]